MFPNYYQPVQQPIQQPIQPLQQPVQPNHPIQNGGYVIVQNDEEIRRYPVAHGNSVTFRIENQPIIVEKSLGYSQFDTPHYERYKLIKEDMPVPEEKGEYLLKSEYEMGRKDFLEVQNEIFSQNKQINEQIELLKEKIDALDKRPVRKKEVSNE